MYDLLTAKENLRTFADLYHIDGPTAKKRVDELLKLVDMDKWADKNIGTFSTGMKQRINVVRALVSDPPLIFMDEPTLGLDPQTTKNIRDFITSINSQGKTIILTTHIMHEAEVLCNRIGIIDHGKIVALDTPANLKEKVRGTAKQMVEMRIPNIDNAMMAAIKASGHAMAADLKDDHIVKIVPKGSDYIPGLVDTVKGAGGRISSINTFEPSLEDVFLFLTGSEMRDQAKHEEKSGFRGRHFFGPTKRVR
jgi:ABC-2 type transport system ATP-binding protein